MSAEQPRIEIVNTLPEHGDVLAALEAVVFPTLAPEEWFTGEMYRAQAAAFPDGQWVALAHTGNGPQVIGCATSLRTSEAFEDDPLPYYFDFIGHGYLTTHEPEGEWLYGVGMMVHPEFRRLGVGSKFYQARQALVQRLNLRGELVAGLMPGYERYRDTLTVDNYAAKVVAGELTDPTLTMQLRNGFNLRRLLHGYIHDSRSGDTATLLVRENPAWQPALT